jgi:NhaC family Na+:H+ antiporter
VSTGGIEGMMPTIYLILSAMVFGGVLMGSGMLGVITHAVTHHIKSSRSTVITTVGTGLMLNACTGDQYLSIILNGNLYRNLYHRNGLEPRLLSRSIEDSTSVTSVLIPWNSCGLTQSAVLGVATLHYLPYCVFNIASPLISIATAWVGFKIKTLHTYAVSPQNFELKS